MRLQKSEGPSAHPSIFGGGPSHYRALLRVLGDAAQLLYAITLRGPPDRGDITHVSASIQKIIDCDRVCDMHNKSPITIAFWVGNYYRLKPRNFVSEYYYVRTNLLWKYQLID